MKLNLGCGHDVRKGYLNVDFERFKGVDKVVNLNKLPYPFRADSADEIIMQNILEHLDSPYEVMKEVYKICKNGAIVHIRTPHFSSNNAWGDIQHKRGYNTQTFLNENMSGMFEVVKQEITFSHWKFFMRPLVTLFPEFYEKHFAYIFNAVDILIDLKVKK